MAPYVANLAFIEHMPKLIDIIGVTQSFSFGQTPGPYLLDQRLIHCLHPVLRLTNLHQTVNLMYFIFANQISDSLRRDHRLTDQNATQVDPLVSKVAERSRP